MSQLTKNLDLEPEHGSLKIGSIRYMLCQPATLAEIQKGVEDRLGPKASEYLYAAGASWALESFRRMKTALPEDPEGLVRAFCRTSTELGWGKWELTNFSSERHLLEIKVFNSPVATAYGQSDLPVCHLLAGAIGGLADSLFSMHSTCLEQPCLSQGNPACQFVATGHDLAGTERWEW